jgi:hypothetical protein
MANYQIFPKIEERKIIFFNLTKSGLDEDLMSTIEDNFIIRLPEGLLQKNIFLSLNKKSIVQALGDNLKDLKLDNYQLSINKSLENDIIELRIEENPISLATDDKEIEFHKLKIKLEDDDESYRLILINEDNIKLIKELVLKIALHNTENGNDIVYRGYCRFQIVQKSKIQLLALDFGSEASQMRKGNYDNNLNISQHKVSLFNLMKLHDDNGPHTKKNEVYKQYETEYLFKSNFYSKNSIDASDAEIEINGNRVFWLENALKMIVPKNANDDQAFSDENKLIPNLKLVKRGSELTMGYQFDVKINNRSQRKNFDSMRESLYLGLLKKMLESFVKEENLEEYYLRLTVLVPNIYSVDEIQDTKKVIGKILENLQNTKMLSGFEIDCLSESDASFLGSGVGITENQFYVIIDCGKGTTDYSIIQFDESSPGTYNSIYRNGIAGAGNYITFSFLKAAYTYLKNNYDSAETFFDVVFSRPQFYYFHDLLFEQIEKWKKNYLSQTISNEDIEQVWREAKTGAYTLEKYFSERVLPDEVLEEKTFISILNNIQHCSDWDNCITDAINDIATNVKNQLEPVINHQVINGFRCGGIILTGRGSMFQPLAFAIKSSLTGIKGMNDAPLINQDDSNLKEVCLSGIFSNKICYYSDLISTPIEVHINELNKQVLKPEVKSFLGKILNRILPSNPATGAAYDSTTNTIEVINSQELINNNVRFWIGGKLYLPHQTYTGSQSLDFFLIPSRKATFIVGKNQENKIKFFTQLVQDADKNDTRSEKRIKESLYPNLRVTPY